MNAIQKISRATLSGNIPDFKPGDVVKVFCKIIEGEKERIQVFEGVVIKKQNNGISSTFIVRKVSYGVGVERIFPLYTPTIERIEILTSGRVRRAKLYYLRDLSGKKARIKGRMSEVQKKLLVAEAPVVETTPPAPQTPAAS